MPTRKLSRQEIEEAERVFGDSIVYDKVWIKEQYRWPYLVAALFAVLTRKRPPRANAVALGNTIWHSAAFDTHPNETGRLRQDDMALLIHELTHVWQYQHFGWRYLLEAIFDQLRSLGDAYRYELAQGKKLADFNREQQAEIARSYYEFLRRVEERGAGEEAAKIQLLIQQFQESRS